jgi:hypothetical protein
MTEAIWADKSVWQVSAAIISAAVGATSLFIAWRNWRESAFRREEVLAWSNEVVRALETLLLICILKDTQLSTSIKREKLAATIIDTSTLVERGRLFFKNEIIDDWGSDKEPAYRGYRPKILDPIVVAYQIACGWNSADEDARLRMRMVAEDCLKKFVSLAQKEVGRSRTVSADTRMGGDGVRLQHLMNAVDDERLAQIAHKERTSARRAIKARERGSRP